MIIDRIDRALDMTSAIVAGIDGGQYADASLCAGWTVRDELNHLVGGMRIFTARLTGTDPGGEHHDDWLGDEPANAFHLAAEADRAAWRRPDALEGVIELGFGAVPAPAAAAIHHTEVLVHGIDLALVTGQEKLVDDQECERLLGEMRAMDFSMFRNPGMFGPETAVADDAPGHRRLLAFLGRAV
ncbi:hypothetical protein Afil01_51510 [Actinorhabdospora filicis]|uniref:Mycothiol-dependent maleylpyruvate isomerase metal-binding domain-containing protein n=1 Tax=Actinorhabdospora filicis TaxID=1785913 RepID=A0A9W6WB72_9ACTN|nr:TIGR03086 family metal-binding protein [Actinorhabdospora filicis]GLZ80344.1 hypothetical protein Afil01_51510 [Actinorhabdospora filicis]